MRWGKLPCIQGTRQEKAKAVFAKALSERGRDKHFAMPRQQSGSDDKRG